MNENNNLVVFIQKIKDSTTLTIENLNGENVATSIVTEIQDMYATGYSPSQAPILYPSGYFGIPNDDTYAAAINIAGSNKSPSIIGTVPTFEIDNPIITDGIDSGEHGFKSNNWGLVAKNDALLAYKFDNDDYRATLNSGEWLGYMMQNRIDEIINMIDEINANYLSLKTQFDAHVHSGVTTGSGNSANPTIPLTQTDLTKPSTLDGDTDYITNENYLLNDSAIVVP